MTTISLPFTFSPNTTAQSSQVNSDFTTIYNDYSGSITDANISSLSESKVVFAALGHAHSGGTGGAPSQWVVGANLTSAATVTPGTDGNVFTVTGATGPITSLGTRNAGVFAKLIFSSTPTLTHNAVSLILPGAANYTAVAGDVLTFMSLGGGNWRQTDGPNVRPATTRSTQDVATSETTTSTSYTDLSTVGPAVTITPGRATDQIIIVGAMVSNSNANVQSSISVAIAGAAATDADRFSATSPAASTTYRGSAHTLATSVASGSTHTAKYKTDANTATFVNRRISAFTLS